MSFADGKRKSSCARCRQSKRRCNGEDPCSNCIKKQVHCDYSQKDRRCQRSSIGYVKSLEDNNEIYEKTLSLLVNLRDDPEKLKLKLESLVSTFPPRDSEEPYSNNFDEEIIPDKDNNSNDDAIIDLEDRYFGPGSIYHFLNFTKPDIEPLMRGDSLQTADSFHVVTLDEDYEYVANIVRYYFQYQYPNVYLYMFDRDTILQKINDRDFDGVLLNKELVYAICANCERLLYQEADGYRDLVLKMIFMDNLSSSIAIAQAYVLIAVHDFSKGQISNGWLLSGLGFRCGADKGFDMNNAGSTSLATNRFYMSSIVIDTYIALSMGRRRTLHLNNLPILRLPGESDSDYLNIKYCVELIEMTNDMLRSTYQPVMFDKDPRINYLLKFNRSKAFNVKILKWKGALDAKCHWHLNSLKNSKTLGDENHTLKYLYYYLLLFLNKPFLHVPKEYSTVYIIEDISKEMYLIVSKLLEKLQGVSGDSDSGNASPVFVNFTESDGYHCATMDVCMLTLLSHVLVTLITSQPQHYMYLEKHFKVFVQYLNIMSPRKYKAKDNPVEKLLDRYKEFKSTVHGIGSSRDPQTSRYEMGQLREAIYTESEESQDSGSDFNYSGSKRLSETSMLSGDFNHNKSLRVPIGQNQESAIKHESPNFHNRIPNGQIYGSAIKQESSPHELPMQNTSQPQQEIYIPMPVVVERHDVNAGYPVMQQYQFTEQGNAYQPVVQGNPGVNYSGVQPVYQDIPYSEFVPKTDAMMQPQPYYTYDQLPPAQDPVGSMMNSLFSNTGQEFATERGLFDWDGLFQEKYSAMY